MRVVWPMVGLYALMTVMEVVVWNEGCGAATACDCVWVRSRVRRGDSVRGRMRVGGRVVRWCSRVSAWARACKRRG